jgi:hypothetical protein
MLPNILFFHIYLKGILLEIANAGFCKEGRWIEGWRERLMNAVFVFHILKFSRKV